MRRDHIPGATIAVVANGKIVKEAAYGLANIELDAKAETDSVYEIGSMTKQFTATLVMLLVEEGKVDLDKSIRTYVEGLPEAWDKATVRRVLSHTSGIPSYTNVVPFTIIAKTDYTPDQIVKMAGAKLNFEPGEQFEYSNTNYYLLGMLIEKITGKSYWDYLSEKILTPLGMTHTRNGDSKTIIPKRVSGYMWNGSEYLNMPWLTPTAGWAAGSLVSTVADLAKWDAALYTEQIIKKSDLAVMYTPSKLNSGGDEAMGYGFGWGNLVENGHHVHAHGGGTAGFSSYISRYTDDKVTVLVLTNLAAADAGHISQGIAKLWIPNLAPKPIEDKDPKTTELIRGVLERMIDGTVTAEPFTKEAAAALFPSGMAQAKAFLKPLGKLKSMALLSDTKVGEARNLAYKIEFENDAYTLRATVTKDGKIAGLLISE